MGIGFSFGTNKKKTDQTTSIDKTEVGSQSGTEQTAGLTTNTTSGTGSTTNQSTGSSTTSQQQTQSGTTATSGQTATDQSSFTPEVGAAIQGSIGDLLAGLGSSRDVISSGLGKLDTFDPSTFIAGIVQQAAAKQQTQLDESVNGMVNTIGAAPDANSMSALLAQRLTNDSAANLAGIQAGATGTAQDILRSNLTAESGAMGTVNNLIPAMIEAFKGANVSGHTTNLAQEISNMVGGSVGTTQTAESSQQQQNTAQTQTQTVEQLITQLMDTLTHTTGTEKTKGTNTSTGGGVSLGF